MAKKKIIEDIIIDEDVAYLIGVLHSDGCIYHFNDKKRNKIRIRVIVTVAQKSLQMLESFRDIFSEKFEKKIKIRKIPKKNYFSIQTAVNSIYHIIQKWEHHKIPLEIIGSKNLFGAYLAGVIDGDGCVKYRKHAKNMEIRISAGHKLLELASLIRFHLECGCHFTKDKSKTGLGYNTIFNVSPKNFNFLMNFVHPHIKISHKSEKLKWYIDLKTEQRLINSNYAKPVISGPVA